jgi:hypothetical protein
VNLQLFLLLAAGLFAIGLYGALSQQAIVMIMMGLALIYTRQTSQATGTALVTMLDWLTHDGQAYAAANGYVPLPPQIQQLARTMLQQITGPTGTQLLS